MWPHVKQHKARDQPEKIQRSSSVLPWPCCGTRATPFSVRCLITRCTVEKDVTKVPAMT